MININDKKSHSTPQNFQCDREVDSEAKISPDGKSSYQKGSKAKSPTLQNLTEVPQKLGLLLFNMAEAKNVLRHQVEDQLEQGFAIPELVDHLVDYLTEVVQEDPHEKRLFNLS